MFLAAGTPVTRCPLHSPGRAIFASGSSLEVEGEVRDRVLRAALRPITITAVQKHTPGSCRARGPGRPAPSHLVRGSPFTDRDTHPARYAELRRAR